MKYMDLTDKRIGNFHVIEYSHSNNNRKLWKCQCKCGNIVYLPRYKILSGNTKSCGCIINEMSHKAIRKNSNGIYYDSKLDLYRARIMRFKKSYHLGRYKNLNDAQNIITIAKTFTTMDNFLKWLPEKKDILIILNQICHDKEININLIIQSIYDDGYEDLYFNIDELKRYVEDFAYTYNN